MHRPCSACIQVFLFLKTDTLHFYGAGGSGDPGILLGDRSRCLPHTGPRAHLWPLRQEPASGAAQPHPLPARGTPEMQARAAKSPVYVSDENGSPPFVATFDGDWREVAGPLILNPLRLKCGWAFLRWHMQVRWRKMSGHGQKSLSPRSRPLCVLCDKLLQLPSPPALSPAPANPQPTSSPPGSRRRQWGPRSFNPPVEGAPGHSWPLLLSPLPQGT